jgi:hypothetical protein
MTPTDQARVEEIEARAQKVWQNGALFEAQDYCALMETDVPWLIARIAELEREKVEYARKVFAVTKEMAAMIAFGPENDTIRALQFSKVMEGVAALTDPGAEGK